MTLQRFSFIVIVVSFITIGFVFFVSATSKDDITFPVAELGGCNNEQECRAYCDEPNNFGACFAFAKKHNLIEGPTGTTQDIDRFAQILQQQGGPGGCRTQSACEDFCSNSANMITCIEWAEQNGLLSGSDFEEAVRIKDALKRGVKLPGGCTSKNSCEAYCQDSVHIDECLAFAEQAGFIPPEELAHAKKFAEAMKNGETPGGCRSKEQCESYCFAEEHMEECMDFAVKNGMMKPKELEMFKKTGGKGPGGCRGRECETYCNDPAHQEECFNWAKDKGLLKEEDLRRIKEGAEQFNEQFAEMPPEVTQCLKETVGENVLSQLQEGRPVFAQDLEEKMRQCFEGFYRNQGFPGMEGGFPGGQEGGMPSGGSPGGCKSPEECIQYCQQHPEECQQFGPPGNVPTSDERFQPPTGGGTSPCPAMPTVSSCPEAQRRQLMYSSPECGDYYACVPEAGLPEAEQYISPEQIQQYQQQYEQQYQEQQQQPPSSGEGFLQGDILQKLVGALINFLSGLTSR